MPMLMPWLIAAGVILVVVLMTVLRRRRQGYDLVTPPRMASQGPSRSAASSAVSPVTLSPEVAQQVSNLLRAGQMIAAIKLVREAADCGLKEARDFTLSMRDALPPAAVSAGTTVPITRQTQGPIALSPEVEQQVTSLLHAGRTIEAIKLVRQVADCGLKEAKDFVDARR